MWGLENFMLGGKKSVFLFQNIYFPTYIGKRVQTTLVRGGREYIVNIDKHYSTHFQVLSLQSLRSLRSLRSNYKFYDLYYLYCLNLLSLRSLQSLRALLSLLSLLSSRFLLSLLS